MAWLAKSLNMKTIRLREMITKYNDINTKTSGRLNTKECLEIYNFWKDNSITSVDRSNGRDIVRVAKVKFLQKYKHFHDLGNEEEQVVLKKTANKKQWVKGPRKVYSKPSRDLYLEYVNKNGSSVHFSTFYKYKPFYVTSPTEREKDCCLCII